jgi:hypothetical protein
MQPNYSPPFQFAEGQTVDSVGASGPPTTDTSFACSSRRSHEQASRAAQARNASNRRRFVDPTTCERDYNEAEMEFMRAMQDYKKSSGRMFPTWSEVLEVLKSLGYEKTENLG